MDSEMTESPDWEEINGFSSPGEYKRFVEYIERQIAEGAAQEIPMDEGYHKGELYGGRWFQESASGEVCRLLEPDFPFRGLWERVEMER